MSISDYRDIVAALRAVPGVAEADVEPDAEGDGLGLLRLGLTAGVEEVAVATEVGKVLREQFGIGVDADRVQLVEDALGLGASVTVEEDPESGPRQRPSIKRMHLVSSGLEVTAAVTLGFGGGTCIGEASGTATQSGVHRAVAVATLRSVEGLLGQAVRFELEHIEVAPTGRDRTVIVGITMLSSTGSERLTGAAAVREDVRQAVIRATLDALNRRLETFLA
jgi:hypothetical protein